ncbi:MAG TPA: cyclophilin-like fold protein [Thermodesulfovibrionales bacterium]|nr:cyclophilin-like fold protein [Thermodesulfovibrionales bacterium]
MPIPIKIVIADIALDGELFDTQCAKAITEALPIETRPDEWGDEFYFGIPVEMPLDETATRKVKVGDVGYWPPGKALAIFFGPTPMSRGSEPVPASEVNLVGKITGDAKLLRKAKGSRRIRIERVSV